ncbi:MAG TPA: ATP-binding protein [Enhygromyxa sp.]|nr:ATP-binding protein [Enhygromyxa sp.]
MSSPAPVDVGDALEDLINQFSDPMSFFRELIQNAIDAGSDQVEIDFEFEASAKDPDSGAMIVIVADSGEGMDREIIDSKLTRLFSSSKDGDMTKIGKFGIGFVSVFAINPDAVCVDTARAGEAWRVLFDRERNFKRLRLDAAIEGTTIRIIKNSTRAEFEQFVARAKQVVRYWCGHAHGEISVAGELVTEPFGLDAPLTVSYQDEFSHIHIGHRRGSETLHAFFNGGLTLVQADHNHPTAIAELRGLCFKVSSRYLEHTLTRDDVIKDGHFGKVVKRLRELAGDELRDKVFAELDAAVRGPWPFAESPEAERLQLLYEAATWHLTDGKGLARAHAKLGCARSPSGRIWTWAELRKQAAEGVWFASARTPLSDAVEALDRVVLCSYGGVSEPTHQTFVHSVVRPLIHGLQLIAGTSDDGLWLGKQWYLPLAPDPAELRQWASLASMAERLLEDTGHKIAKVAFGHFGPSGSLLDGRAVISQREFGEATPRAESGELGKGLFSRRRTLVVDADHPTVRNLLGLAVREPELAAYQLVKLFLLASGSIASADDSQLANVAMTYRETRCPRPMS